MAGLFSPLIFVRKIDNFFLFSLLRALGIVILFIVLISSYISESKQEELSNEYDFWPSDFEFS